MVGCGLKTRNNCSVHLAQRLNKLHGHGEHCCRFHNAYSFGLTCYHMEFGAHTKGLQITLIGLVSQMCI